MASTPSIPILRLGAGESSTLATTCLVLETLCNILKVPTRQKLRGALGRIALARHSQGSSGAASSKWHGYKYSASLNRKYSFIHFHPVDQMYHCKLFLFQKHKPRCQESPRKHPIVWACVMLTGTAGFAAINSPKGSVFSCFLFLSLLLLKIKKYFP